MVWLQKSALPALATGFLVVACGDLPKGWHASVAKNTSHKVAIETLDRTAGGSAPPSHFLVNLDVDNIIGPDFMEALIKEVINLRPESAVQGQGKVPGTTGRVCLWEHDFLRLGGYDEDMLPMGYHDIDLMRRCQKAGGSVTSLPKGAVGTSVPNNLSDKVAAFGIDKVRNVGSHCAHMSWGEMNDHNRKLAANKLKKGTWWRT